MIWIDFRGSNHGNFLEYVINVWIMGITPDNGSVFDNNGACHNFSKYYQKNRKVQSGHWWWSEYKHQKETDPVIRIEFDRFNNRSFYIALVNRWHRSGGLSYDQKVLSLIDEDTRNSPTRFRNQYYHQYKTRKAFGDFIEIPNNIQEFDFESFFIWSEFCRELTNIAKFLNQKFIPDQELYKLWQEFIRLNQGYHSYYRCADILEKIFLEQPMPIRCTPYEEAWINYNITKMTGVDRGPLFTDDIYPTNTAEVYKLITHYV